MKHFLGIDVGGTKCHVLVADETGCARSFSQGGAGNPHSVGYDALSQLLVRITGEALEQAGIGPGGIAGVGMGVGGYDWPSEHARTVATLAPIGMAAPVALVNDAGLGIWAGTEEGWGVAVVSGTGCNCRGRNREGREGRVTGHGLWMGEGAGAVELTARALQAIAYEWTRRGPETSLTAAFVEYYKVRDVAELLERATTEMDFVNGSEARVVFQVASAGDPVAQDMILWAGRELAGMVTGVVRQIEIENEEFDVVMVGSTFNGSPMLAEAMKAHVRSVAPRARFVRLSAPPVVGAVLLGMAEAGQAAFQLRSRLVDSTCQLIQGSRSA